MRQVIQRTPLLLSCLLAMLVLTGCITGPDVYSQNVASISAQVPIRVTSRPYVLGANDQLHVQVYNEPSITGDYAIDGSGFLSVPVAGRVRAAGLTTEQLERRLTGRLNGGILKDARVSIQIATYAPFYIRGEVKKPGEFPYKPGLTLGDAVALAGGYTYRADESRAHVRPAGVATEITRPLDLDPLIAPGDNIRIPERFF